MPKSQSNSDSYTAPNNRRPDGSLIGVLGLGASAGGVAALREFFEGMSSDSGLAFVVVMHLSPEHESSLAEVLQPNTAMPVIQVQDEVKVEPNHVYVIPPNKHLTMADSTLRLSERQQAPGRRVTIDLFFRTLADAYGQRSLCAILTGTDSDGVIGLKHIKAQGGVTIAQDPEEAEHDTMPRSAIETGMVDWILPVREMPKKLLEFVQNEKRMALPPERAHGDEHEAEEAGGGRIVAQQTDDPADENALQEVLVHLRSQTGHDFAHYKRATVLRRIARRLQVNSIEDIPSYLEFLRTHSGEARALLQDLLISVTHFFRDQEAFAALEANIPQLFTGKGGDDQVRIWVPACATGEEAYSIAMLLCEQAARLENPPSVQVFATDIDEEAISDARDGLYPNTIEADVSQERLRQFFTRDHGRYRVRKEIREAVLFAPHNLLKDPPFSRLDLVSCRNLLIYLKRASQGRVLDIFHFVLRPSGLLFVGGSESVEDAALLFAPLDKHHRVYVRRAAPRPAWMIPTLPLGPVLRRMPQPTILRAPKMSPMHHPAIVEPLAEAAPSTLDGRDRRALFFGELHLQLLEKYAPPSVVINENYDIVHLSAHAGRYLRFGGGEPSANLFDLVHPALRLELRTAIFRARQENEKISVRDVAIEVDDETELLDLHVQRVVETDAAQGFALIIFERQSGAAPDRVRPAAIEEPLARHLEKELQDVKQQLSSTVEQYEASNEELKASNEELQAMNEEVRSTAEELETSKEELQSINEELTTVNQELKSNIEQLSRANSDLQNLMTSTDIGTIFLDRELRIERFTPSAQKIFNLIPADLGRPLADITHKLTFEGFITDAEKVLRDLVIVEHEVRAGGNAWYLTRLAPYRTGDDRISGVVATFVEITRRKLAEEELRALAGEMEQQLQKFNTILASVPDFIYRFDLEGRFTYINQSLLNLWKKTNQETLGRNFHQLGYPPELATKLQRQIQEVIETQRPLKDLTPYTSAAGERQYEYLFFPVIAADGSVEAVGGVTRDITERLEAEAALRSSEERFRQFADNSSDVLWIIDAETSQLEYLSPSFEQVWGESRASVLHDLDHWREILHPDDREPAAARIPHLLKGVSSTDDYRIIRPSDGALRWIRDISFPIRDGGNKIKRVAGVARDVTDEKKQLEAMAESEERFRLLVEGAPDYAMFLLDPGNQIVYWSGGAEKVFGWSANEALGKSGELIFTPEDRARHQEAKEINTALRKGVASDRRWHLRKDDSRVWIDGVMRRLNDEEGNLRAFAKIGRDATGLHLAEQALQRSHQDLEQRVDERTKELVVLNKELGKALKKRAEVEQELLLVSEREKRRIGQDLHDSLCQELAAAAFFLQSTAQKMGKKFPAEAEVVSEAAKIVNDNVGLARDLARGLHPVELSSTGLANALRELAFRTSQLRSVTCHFDLPRQIRIQDEAIALNFFRIAQEAVANAIKNGKATEVSIRLGRDRKGLSLTVRDNGKGFSQSKPRKGMGIHIMQYRAEVIGARFSVESADGEGTQVTCTLPGE
ncbi:MAG: PAS domain S-box protein [Spartobacteria bacterium]